jgi:hypothetical protein
MERILHTPFPYVCDRAHAGRPVALPTSLPIPLSAVSARAYRPTAYSVPLDWDSPNVRSRMPSGQW